MKMMKFFFLISCAVISSSYAEEGGCAKCQMIREYNAEHPQKCGYYEDYLKEHPEQAAKQQAEQPQPAQQETEEKE